MGRPRLIDYEEVRRLYATGDYTQRQLADMFGVSTAPIERAVTAGYAERQARRQEKLKVPCANGCGNLVHGRYAPGRLCRDCWAESTRTSVRETTLKCCVCQLWDFDKGFPRSKHEPHRRGRHTVCRKCQAGMRQRSRINRYVPCADCGTPRIHPDDAGGKRRGLPDSGLCRPCWQKRQAAWREAGLL